MEKIVPLKIVAALQVGRYRVYWTAGRFSYSLPIAVDELDAFVWSMSPQGQVEAIDYLEKEGGDGKDNPG